MKWHFLRYAFCCGHVVMPESETCLTLLQSSLKNQLGALGGGGQEEPEDDEEDGPQIVDEEEALRSMLPTSFGEGRWQSAKRAFKYAD